MTIKEVSKKFGISEDTLRYYEKMGIIRPVTRKNGIRNYGEKELANIEFVVCMRSAGLTVDALAEYIKLFDEGDSTLEKRKQLLTDQREKLIKKSEDINKAIDKLNFKIDKYYSDIVEKEKALLKK